MPRKLSEDARTLLLSSAVQEATGRGDRRVGTDHLLLAVLREPDSGPARALGVGLAAARDAEEALDQVALAAIGVGADVLTAAGPGDLPGARPAVGRAALHRLGLSHGARSVLKRAVDLARAARSGQVEAGHFLLALLELQRPDPAAELLASLGVDRDAVRARLEAVSGS
jgi:ATP-dependent Clp protease ATP-binding subunit ClpA